MKNNKSTKKAVNLKLDENSRKALDALEHTNNTLEEVQRLLKLNLKALRDILKRGAFKFKSV